MASSVNVLKRLCPQRGLRGYQDQGKLDSIWLKELGLREEGMEKSPWAQLYSRQPPSGSDGKCTLGLVLCVYGTPAPGS